MALAASCALAVSPAPAAPAAGASPSPSGAPLSAPELTAPPAGGVAAAPEGHLVAAWEPAGDGTAGPLRYQLQTGRDPCFAAARTIEAGAARASFLSGLRAGDTWVRVRAVAAGGAAGPWSDAGTVRVDYPDRRLVRNLFALGAVTGAALLAAIVLGARRSARRAARQGRTGREAA